MLQCCSLDWVCAICLPCHPDSCNHALTCLTIAKLTDDHSFQIPRDSKHQRLSLTEVTTIIALVPAEPPENLTVSNETVCT